MTAALNLSANIPSMAVLLFLMERGGLDVINTPEDSRVAVLNEFCWAGNEEGVQYLLGQGVDPNVCNDKGVIPLIEVIFYEYEEVALLLINYGANLNVKSKDKWGAQPLSLAKRRKLKRVVAAIEAKMKSE